MLELQVANMDCGGCAKGVTRAIEATAPGARIAIDLPTRTVRLDGAPDAEAIVTALRRAGFEATPASQAA